MKLSVPIFKAFCRSHGLPTPMDEYQFHDSRKWRFDFAWPLQKVALEVDGGIFVNGRHNQGAAMLLQWEKENTAQSMGWHIFKCSPSTALKSEIVGFLKLALK
jgi:hypothetical protein